jgi:hypothetical protein
MQTQPAETIQHENVNKRHPRSKLRKGWKTYLFDVLCRSFRVRLEPHGRASSFLRATLDLYLENVGNEAASRIAIAFSLGGKGVILLVV